MTTIPPGYANATFVFLRAGDLDPYTTSLGMDVVNEAFDPSDADVLAGQMAAAAAPNHFSIDTLLQIDWAYNDGGGVVQHVSPIGTTGTLSSPASAMPQNNALLIQKRTATAGRKGRGRMYWPFLNEADCDSVGTVISTAKTRLNTMTTSWMSNIASNPGFGGPVLLHTAPGDPPREITAFTVASVIATQRRRLRK